MALTFDTSHVKTRLSELVGRVSYGRERVVVLRRGKPMAALISVEDLRRLETLETATNNRGAPAVHPIMRAFGGWADRSDLDNLVAEIYANRAAATGREVSL